MKLALFSDIKEEINEKEETEEDKREKLLDLKYILLTLEIQYILEISHNQQNFH